VEEEEEGSEAASPVRTNGAKALAVEGEDVVDIRKSLASPLEDSTTKAVSTRHSRPRSLVVDQIRGAALDAEDKDQPPLPKFTAGDSTVAGQHWPLVDEIACAIREWYGVSDQLDSPRRADSIAITDLSCQSGLQALPCRHTAHRCAPARQKAALIPDS
jgi:hypothetical protein